MQIVVIIGSMASGFVVYGVPAKMHTSGVRGRDRLAIFDLKHDTDSLKVVGR